MSARAHSIPIFLVPLFKSLLLRQYDLTHHARWPVLHMRRRLLRTASAAVGPVYIHIHIQLPFITMTRLSQVLGADMSCDLTLLPGCLRWRLKGAGAVLHVVVHTWWLPCKPQAKVSPALSTRLNCIDVAPTSYTALWHCSWGAKSGRIPIRQASQQRHPR